MSESVASALEFLDNDNTRETRLFIRMVDRFFFITLMYGLPWLINYKGRRVLLPTESQLISNLRYYLYILHMYLLIACYMHVCTCSGYEMIS